MMRVMKNLLALVLGLAFVTPALAQDDPSTTPPANQEIVEQCLADLRAELVETRDEIAAQTRETVETIRELGLQGAPKPTIVAAGREGLVENTQIALAARGEVRATGGECIEALLENEASKGAVRVVKRATKYADRLVHRGVTNSRQIIRIATRQALKGSGEVPVVTEQDVITDAELDKIETGGK